MARVNRARRLTYLKDRQLIEFNRASKVEGFVSRLVPSKSDWGGICNDADTANRTLWAD
jgi:hypothetical protein